MDPRVQKMADVLVNYCVETQPKDWVVIRSGFLGEPLVNSIVSSVLKAGAYPNVFFHSEEVMETSIREASDDQLSFIAPANRVVMEQAKRMIALMAPYNTRTMANVDPSRMALANKAQEPLMEVMMQRSASEDLWWTGAAYPTYAGAQDAGMSLRDYQEFVYGAGLLDEPDPVQAWKELGQRQQRLADWLKDKKTVHIRGEGTNLKVGIAGRTWLNDDGHKNFPGGEIFTGPEEEVTEGVIEFTYPGYYQGREVPGIRLVFERGRVVEASARGDEAYFLQMLDMDEGARCLGEFAFGCNQGIQRFSKNTLFDEKIGGTLHMALGRAYPESGGKNMSALHWDIVYDLRQAAEVDVDGQPFSRNGQFCI